MICPSLKMYIYNQRKYHARVEDWIFARFQALITRPSALNSNSPLRKAGVIRRRIAACSWGSAGHRWADGGNDPPSTTSHLGDDGMGRIRLAK